MGVFDKISDKISDKFSEQFGDKIGVSKLGQVLNADVGKVLRTDVSEIAKGASQILLTDVTELVGRKTDPQPPVSSGTTTVLRNTETSQNLGKPAVKITSALVQRQQRSMPEGRSLATLLPAQVEAFRRDAHHPTGQIADDPVTANYFDGAEIVVVEVAVGWDPDEAKELVRARAIHAGPHAKFAPDGSWVIGRGESGAYFGWTRGPIFYGVLAQGGASGLVRFVEAFPY
jgi:hypothetical protein